MEFYSVMRRKDILPFEIRINLEDATLSEIIQTEKDKQCMKALIHGIRSQAHKNRGKWWLPEIRRWRSRKVA